MMFILDASVALKWTLAESHSNAAIRLRDEMQADQHDVLAPDVLPAECAHALTRAERRGAIPVGTALPALRRILAVNYLLEPSLPLLSRAVELSSRHRIGAYDCLYVALAERCHCDLVTADDRLLSALPGFPIVHVSSL